MLTERPSSPAQATESKDDSPAQPIRLELLGGSGVGKTCFVASLALLAENPRTGWQVHGEGPATMKRFDDLRNEFKAGNWPTKTSMTQPIRIGLVQGSRRYLLELVDFPGELFHAAYRHGEEGRSINEVNERIRKADFLCLLIDAPRLKLGEVNGALELLQSLYERLTSSDSVPELFVVLTKSDGVAENPPKTPAEARKLLEGAAPNLSAKLSEYAGGFECFPVTSLGFQPPDDSPDASLKGAQPTGFEFLFSAIAKKRSREKHRREWNWAIGVAVGLLLLCSWLTFLRSQQIAKIKDRNTPVIQLPIWPILPGVESELRTRLKTELDELKRQLNEAGNHRAIEGINSRVVGWSPKHRSLVQPEYEELTDLIEERREAVSYEKVQDAWQEPGQRGFASASADYLAAVPQGKHADEVRGWREEFNQEEYQRARSRVQEIVVSDLASLKRKVEVINQFLDLWQESVGAEAQNMRRACNLATSMQTWKTYHITLVQTGGFDSPCDHGVELFVGDDSTPRAVFDDSGDVNQKNWNTAFPITWKAGEKIRLKLLNYDGWNSDIAEFAGPSPLDIIMLGSRFEPTRYGEHFVTSRPAVYIKCRCAELDAKDIEALRKYILPGDGW